MPYDLPRSTLFYTKKMQCKQMEKTPPQEFKGFPSQNSFTNADLEKHSASTKLLIFV